MTRDLDLFRQIVIALESATESVDSYNLAIDGQPDQDRIAYHCLLLREAGLIHVPHETNPRCHKHTVLTIERLTNEGHDFYDAIKDKDKWNLTTSLMSAVKQVTLPVLVNKLQEMTAQGWDVYMKKIHSLAKEAGLL